MKHYGDITKLHGYEIEPVDCITGGSPCQGLSVAGKKEGLDDERSKLFFEMVRIIKEMKEATNGEYPKFIIWENVRNAFSSHEGNDFRCVLEEFARIAEPDISISKPTGNRGKWSKAGAISGNGWSIAWRLFDSQFWQVAQRRERIALVMDLRGQRAAEILFERKGMSGNFEESIPTWQTASGITEDSTGRYDRMVGGGSSYTLKIRSGCEGGGKGALVQTEKTGTLSTLQDQTLFQPISVGFPLGFRPENARCYEEKATTLCNGTRPGFTVGCIQPNDNMRYLVRRLTPVEYERLQGFPSGWTDIGEWVDEAGKKHESKDTPRYKALGNSIALPQWFWISQKMKPYLGDGATLGSLFDGISGFPLVWTKTYGEGSAIWSSEVEPFCIAVAKKHFPENT